MKNSPCSKSVNALKFELLIADKDTQLYMFDYTHPLNAREVSIQAKQPVRDIKKRNRELTNSPKCCKMSFKASKMKEQGLKCFLK